MLKKIMGTEDANTEFCVGNTYSKWGGCATDAQCNMNGYNGREYYYEVETLTGVVCDSYYGPLCCN